MYESIVTCNIIYSFFYNLLKQGNWITDDVRQFY